MSMFSNSSRRIIQRGCANAIQQSKMMARMPRPSFIGSSNNNNNNTYNNARHYSSGVDELIKQLKTEREAIVAREAEKQGKNDPEELVPFNPSHFITYEDIGVNLTIGEPKPLERISEQVQLALQNKDYRYLNPYTYLFPQRTFAMDLAYTPLKLRSMWKSMIPFKRDKLEKRLLANFHRLISSIENNDIEALNDMRLDGTQMAIESFRDVFHTLRAEKINYTFTMRDVRVVIDHVEPSLPFFLANALYFIDGEFRLPDLDDKPVQVSFFTPIVWLSKFPELAEDDLRPLEQINFDTEVEWKPSRIDMIGVVREIADARVAVIMQKLKEVQKRVTEEAQERNEQRLAQEKLEQEEKVSAQKQ
ncbi:hypothetical protein SAMD00019534_089580 [Acytostelium subglobosum LB1]|uniref:hypothetical protein n=1 Tax=Acytostelium subglobosum LB1 TaxID=1410327 RepID=UPI00064500CE|nr:hypothetical protein SAMD00019534_089580 [Acytostelium subglobosum LB1]GAM25783.1 hypothetical protein SAMD00019534_089580 [Acytostelium subglobosum LB1]|eukprot:XP_012751301.1 hypothetical protein SAMD00019534_089580 [Acytostelium subglobosum LB1]